MYFPACIIHFITKTEKNEKLYHLQTLELDKTGSLLHDM